MNAHRVSVSESTFYRPVGTHLGQQSPGAWCALKSFAQRGVPQKAPLHSEGAFSFGAVKPPYQEDISAGSYDGATSEPNVQNGQQEPSCLTLPGGGQLSSPQTVPPQRTGSCLCRRALATVARRLIRAMVRIVSTKSP